MIFLVILVVHHIVFHGLEPLSRQNSASQGDSYNNTFAGFSCIYIEKYWICFVSYFFELKRSLYIVVVFEKRCPVQDHQLQQASKQSDEICLQLRNYHL